MANTMAAIVTLNAVLPNWPPQERPIDAASKPSSRNTDTMPAEYQTLSTSACVRLWPACCDEAHHLEPDHRQHARHQIENDAADEREQRCSKRASRRFLSRRCGLGRSAADRGLRAGGRRGRAATGESLAPGGGPARGDRRRVFVGRRRERERGRYRARHVADARALP